MSAALDLPFRLDEVTVHTGASIGIALAPEHAVDSTELLRCADVAMYRAKTRHTAVEVYEPVTDTNLGRFQLVHELRQAIAQRELTLFFQPQVDLRSHTVRSVEALVRWPHPTRGWVAPDEFIPLAEECRLMRPLLRLVLDQALAQAAAWRRAGTPVTVAVNLSATNVLDADLTYDIARKLELHGVPASALRLEITEGVLLVDPVRAAGVLDGLRAAGLSISIDDFGTGFSSLAYLRELPVDELKVDRAFVSQLADPDSTRDAAIAHSALTLGHALGMTVVAEGVENAATLEILTDLGFDGAQGYHLGRPAPADALDLSSARTSSGQR